MFNQKLQTLLSIALILGLGVSFGVVVNKNQVISGLSQQLEELKNQLTPALPANAKYSEAFTNQCVVGFKHYVTPETSLGNPIGPVYLVADNKLVGVGYMFTESALKEHTTITPDKIERPFFDSGPLTLGYKVDHVHIQFIPGGHEGLEEDHYDVHFFFISHEEEEALKL